MSIASSCALAALLLLGPPAVSSREALHAQVLRLLERPDDLPREEEWTPLGPDALPELLGLASDATVPEPRRLRAVAALAVVAHTEAPQRLQQLARDSATPAAVRSAAMGALGRRAGIEAVPALLPLLSDPSEGVRASAAQTLGQLGGAEARQALEGRLAREDQPAVREALQQALSYLEP